jgi:hypothetical protein
MGSRVEVDVHDGFPFKGNAPPWGESIAQNRTQSEVNTVDQIARQAFIRKARQRKTGYRMAAA